MGLAQRTQFDSAPMSVSRLTVPAGQSRHCCASEYRPSPQGVHVSFALSKVPFSHSVHSAAPSRE